MWSASRAWRTLIRPALLLVFTWILVLIPAMAPAQADNRPVNAISDETILAPTVTGDGSHVYIDWNAPETIARTDAMLATWPRVDLNGVEAPARLIPVQIVDADRFSIQLDLQASRAVTKRSAWKSIAPPVPQPLDDAPRPDLAPKRESAGPDSPLFVLRQARVRGQDVAILALTPYYQVNGALQMATAFQATVRGAQVLSDALALASFDDSTAISSGEVAAPSPLSARERAEVQVREEGIQQISLAQLQALGLIDNKAKAEFLHLYLNGKEIPWHLTADGNALRFYAAQPGDRWNAIDRYWLILEKTAANEMASRVGATGAFTGTVQEVAWEWGTWREPTLYDSTLPGPDGDHWFSADLRTGPELEPMTVTVPIPSVLPAEVSGTAYFTLAGSAHTGQAHRLQVGANNAQTLEWSGLGDWVQSFTQPGGEDLVTLIQTPGAAPDGIELDALTWLRPVQLHFSGSGAAFEVQESGRYRLSQLPVSASLYDVTDPLAPVRIVATEQPDGSWLLDSPGASRYLVTADAFIVRLPVIHGGDSVRSMPLVREIQRSQTVASVSRRVGIVHDPVVSMRPALDFTSALNADAIYVAPAAFHSALTPLLSLRKAQGYQPVLVDVQAIYDGWSGGQVAPPAIREFLRWVAANSTRPPLAMILIGDGTSDPHNYLGRNNTNWIPPYLAMVDPWLGETSCEICYGQLDGADPLDDVLPDVAIGRIPAKSAEETAAYVAKLVQYETTLFPFADRIRAVYVADNYRDANGDVDGGGDFAAAAEDSIQHLPPGVDVQRVYYDPSPTHVSAPWREPDALAAHEKTVSAISQGAGFVTYFGHSHQWQWASTDLNVEPSYLFGLFDVDKLQNGPKLPIVLGMTCLTGMFQQPAFSGTTLDERMMLKPDGGAAAVWGPTGLGVAYGHDALQGGFYKRFWSRTSTQKRLAELTQSGLVTLFTEGKCCQETLRTFALFGDPLTTPQAASRDTVFVPFVGR